jgi:hypothetical protein
VAPVTEPIRSILRECDRMHLGDDDPLRLILTALSRAVAETRAAAVLAKEAAGAQGLSSEGERVLIERVSREAGGAVLDRLDEAVRSRDLRAWLGAGFLAALFLIFGLGLGWYGRGEAVTADDIYAACATAAAKIPSRAEGPPKHY